MNKEEEEPTFYNWDEAEWPTPSQTQEIIDYLKLIKDIHNGKPNATDRSVTRPQPAANDKPRA